MVDWHQLIEASFGGQPIPSPHPGAPPLSSGLDALAKSQIQRAERVVLFADELASALATEFASLWRPGATVTGALADLVGRVDALKGQVAQARAFLERVRQKPAADALRLVRELDLAAVTASAHGLEAVARRAREALAAPSPEQPHFHRPAPAPRLNEAPKRGTGLLGKLGTGPLSKLGTGPLGKPSTGKPGTGPLGRTGATGPLAEPAVDPALDKKKQAFEAARTFVAEVLAYVSPRLSLVKFSLDATGLPGKRTEWETLTRTLLPNAAQAGIERAQMTWLTALAKLFYQDMGAVQKAHGAVVQWEDARVLDEEARLLEGSLSNVPPPRQGAMLAAFNLGKYRAAIFPVSHLHLTFRGTPTLGELFPPPPGAPNAGAGAGLGTRRLEA